MPAGPRARWLTFLAVVWALALVSWVTWRVFTDPPSIPVSTATVYGTLMGLPGIVWGWFVWVRREPGSRDD